MAKEVAIGKRAKISEAQQQMLIIVLGASIILGVGIALTSHFLRQISFNAKVIAAEEQSIVAYSDVIKSVGVCEAPKGKIYSDAELSACDPDSIEISQIPGTLRANILENLASNQALNSVPKESDSGCLNAEGKTYTLKELNKIYQDAEGSEALQSASNLIKRCSALRIIPDALPAFENQEALLSSLNKLFLVTGIEPEGINPNNDEGFSDDEETTPSGSLYSIPLTFSMENGYTGVAANLFRNIERSIREMNVNQLEMEFKDGGLSFTANAEAYFTNESEVSETTTTITEESQ